MFHIWTGVIVTRGLRLVGPEGRQDDGIAAELKRPAMPATCRLSLPFAAKREYLIKYDCFINHDWTGENPFYCIFLCFCAGFTFASISAPEWHINVRNGFNQLALCFLFVFCFFDEKFPNISIYLFFLKNCKFNLKILEFCWISTKSIQIK